MQNEISKLAKEIRANVHPSNFETETVENSREQIKKLYFSALQLSLTSNNSFNENKHVQYDSKTLFHLFFYKRERDRVHRHQMNYYSIGINWVHLCKDHDSQRRNESYLKQQEEGYNIRNRNHTTLELAVEALLDASIIPPCLTGATVEGLFITCIEVFSSFSSSLGRLQLEPKQNIPSSLRLLQNTIQLLLQKAPIVNISKKIEMYVFTFFMGTIRSEIQRPFTSHPDASRCIQDIIRNYNTLKSNTVLSIMNDLILMKNARDMNGTIVKIKNRIHAIALINPLLCLIREIDDMDIFLLEQEDKCHDQYHIPCRNCRFKLSKYEHCNRKRQKTLSNEELHDELPDEKDPFALLFSSKKGQDRSLVASTNGKLEFKNIIGANDDEQNERPHVTCMYCANQEKSTSGRITALSIKMVEFREHLYRLYFEVLQRELHRNGACNSTLLSSIFRFAIQNHKSPSSRLCAIYAADLLGIQQGYMQYITYIGKLLNHELDHLFGSQTIRICIHIYCEVIFETSVFEDASTCWSALEPLLKVVLTIHEESKLIAEENILKEIVDEALKAIGWLLTKRHYVFQNTDTDKTLAMSFNSFALRFSEEFERREHWIHNMMSATMQSQIESTLQKLGILSFCQTYDSKTSTKITEEIWSYDPSFSIRASNLRMGPILAQNSIFSNDHIQNQHHSTSKRQVREREDSVCGESIINVINDDITHLIFSFFGYKLLARASSVCKCWRSIANHNLFWESFFIRRFKPRFLHSLLEANVNTNVKSMFISRYCQYDNINWRERFNQSKHSEAQLKTKITNGFRHYQCRVFGCNVVIKKKESEEKHMQKHRRDVEKKVLVILRAEERRLQREQQRKKKNARRKKDKKI